MPIDDRVEVILDISRLLSRSLHPRPTGVDRVEMAYAQFLRRRLGDRLQYSAVNPLGFGGRLDRAEAEAFIDRTHLRWNDPRRPGKWELRYGALADIFRLSPRRTPSPDPGVRRYLLQASPNHLDKPAIVRRKLEREQARFICVVFDLIPIEFPEYGRPDGAAKHLARVRTMASTAHGLVAISAAVARSMEPYLPADGPRPALTSALLGVDIPTLPVATRPAISIPGPYFIYISTIEPRKNHLLLLNIWRQMVAERGAGNTPHLVIIGRRGWENENVVDMLERCEAIAGNITELTGLSDDALFPLLAGARALLFPSFAEGFGLPVAEALALGTPVISSDIPALKEAGMGIPDYISPLDGPTWIEAILDYAGEASPARAAQMERMSAWRTPDWDEHIDRVLAFIAEIDRTV